MGDFLYSAGGAPSPRGGGCPPAPDPASTPAVARSRPLPHVAGPLCPLVCLRIPRQGEAHRDRCGPVQAARLHVAVPRDDRPTCKDLTAGWPQKERS
jgi:hypothetical protein